MEVIEESPQDYYDRSTGRYRFDFSPLPRHVQLFYQALSCQKERLTQFSLSPEERRNLYIINLNWTQHLDFWPLHLISDAVPLYVVLLPVSILCALFVMSSILLRKTIQRDVP